ncbi:THAP domain-containing protein 2-like [Colossoma macropomum]|uniref:THAP domain-containing protein 2-like n=1 Tax=Colossoma macropomum TaxID=42526 RepID=UPI001864BA6B|nr:THAP domain-containing protein 2-like [Colossoma macropomum]
MAESSRRCYCSVPRCSNSKQRHPYLSFHDFPKDKELRRSWVRLIRRDEGPLFNIVRGSTFVCSLHFESVDIYVSKSGRKRLKTGAVPRRFSWNNWGNDHMSRESAFDRASARFGVDVRGGSAAGQANEVSTVDAVVELQHTTDHNYYACSPSGALEAAAVRIRKLEAKVRELES